jgi:large subunit ribosomal protein L24
MIKFSSNWISSKSRRKQRKYRLNAPLHIKRKFTACHLSKELRKKYGARAVNLRKNDTVKILKGSHKNKTGKIIEIDTKKNKAYIQDIDITKKDGTKIPLALYPSNLMITALAMDDKNRAKIFERKKL